MAAPEYGANGAGGSSTISTTLALPAGVAPGNLMFIPVETDGSTPATPSGWTAVSANPQATSTTTLCAFLRRFQTGDSGPTFAVGASDHVVGQVGFIDDGGVVGDPVTPHAITGSLVTGTTTAVSISGLTTTVADCLVLSFASAGTDANTAQFSGWTNASLTSVTERMNFFSVAGGGGGFGMASGVKATAGVVSATTATLAAASRQGCIMMAFAPIPSVLIPKPRTVLRAVQRASLY